MPRAWPDTVKHQRAYRSRRAVTVSGPTDEAIRIEPVASEAQRNSVYGYIERGMVSTSSADEHEPQDGLGLCSDSVTANLADSSGVAVRGGVVDVRTEVTAVGAGAGPSRFPRCPISPDAPRSRLRRGVK